MRGSQTRFLSLCFFLGFLTASREAEGGGFFLCRDFRAGAGQRRGDNVIIKCGICGNEIELVGEIANGQRIVCPYCGEKSEYRKPSRIELPTGLHARRTLSTPPKSEDAPPQKTTLRVIRTENQPSPQPNMDAERKIRIAEEHVRFYEEMKDREHRRKRWDKIVGILLVVAFVGGLFGTYVVIQNRKERLLQAERIAAAERAQRAEEERQERARREAEEKEARARREAEEKIRLEKKRAEEEREKAERAKQENKFLEEKVLYKKTVALFRDGEFDFIKALPKDQQPGKCAGEFFYLLPFMENEEVIICKSTPRGIESVCRLDVNGTRTPFEAETFLSSLDGKDFLVATGDKVYFQSKRKKPHIGQISKKEVTDLTKAFFGDLAPEIRRFDLDPEELRFEIVFIPRNSKKVIISETVESGVAYSLEKVREAVEEAFPMKAGKATGGGKVKRFKRTVVLWDGALGKKGIDGVTYVPRVAPPSTREGYWYRGSTVSGPGWDYVRADRNYYKAQHRAIQSREQWQALYDEAVRQEQQEREYYEQQANARRARAEKANAKAEQAYDERIDAIMNEGTLYFRAKVAHPEK